MLRKKSEINDLTNNYKVTSDKCKEIKNSIRVYRKKVEALKSSIVILIKKRLKSKGSSSCDVIVSDE